MTAQLIAPLIPPRAQPGAREHGKAATARRLPVAAAPEVPAVPDDVAYGTGRMGESGRVADRAMIAVLGWRPGDRLTLTAAAGVVFAGELDAVHLRAGPRRRQGAAAAWDTSGSRATAATTRSGRPCSSNHHTTAGTGPLPAG